MKRKFNFYHLLLITQSFRKKSLYLLGACFICFISCNKDTTIGGGTGGGGTGNLAERRIIDTAYGTDTHQKIDIYLPAGRTAATKVIFTIHGGGWEEGDKSSISDIDSMLHNKWPEAAIVNVNYRLTSNASVHHTEIMGDITTVVNLIKNNKAGFVVSDTFFMLGQSAGAHLAMLYTYGFNTGGNVKAVSDFYGPANMRDWAWYNAVFFWNGKTVKDLLTRYNNTPWDTAVYDSHSPYALVTAATKPTIVFHGTIDPVVPIYQSQWLHSRLNTFAVPNEYYEYFLDGHGFNYTNNADAVNKTVTFFKLHTQ